MRPGNQHLKRCFPGFSGLYQCKPLLTLTTVCKSIDRSQAKQTGNRLVRGSASARQLLSLSYRSTYQNG